MRNFLEKTAAAAFDILLASTHDLCWNAGPFGESFGANSYLFLGSSVNLETVGPMDDSEAPLTNEPFITLDWSLVMTEGAQEMLFHRIRATFESTTAMIPANHKKKYRLSGEELVKLRNLMVLFQQMKGHLQTRMSPLDLEIWVKELQNGPRRDEDLLAILGARPARFAMSMLPSQQQKAKAEMEDVEVKRVEAKEQQRQEVTAAQWTYFKGALKRDQDKLAMVNAAPRLVKQKLHSKTVAHRARQASEGETACKAYQDRGSSLSGSFHASTFIVHRFPPSITFLFF